MAIICLREVSPVHNNVNELLFKLMQRKKKIFASPSLFTFNDTFNYLKRR